MSVDENDQQQSTPRLSPSRSRSSERMKRLWATDEWQAKMRRAVAEGSKRRWDDPDGRAKTIAAQKRGWQTADKHKKENSERMKARWRDPAFRTKMKEVFRRRQKIWWSDPQNREAARERLRERHKNPAYRKALEAGFRRAWNDPKRRAEMTAHATARLRRQGAGRYYFLDRLGRVWFFRSGDEHERGAAMWFDRAGLLWFYEPCVLALPAGESYLPDFWVVEWNAYVEVKGADFRLNKVEAARTAGHIVHVVHSLDELATIVPHQSG